MKKKFSNFLIVTVTAGIVLSLVGVALISQAKTNEGLSRPIPATDVKIVKKTFLPPEIGEMKGKPATPPGKDKNNGPAANGVLGEPLSEGANKYAIVIGICDYPVDRYDICKSDGDSLNMYNALVNLYGYYPENIILLRDMNATFDAISSAILDPETGLKAKEVAGDEVVFFFSGHGADGIAKDTDKETRDEGIVTHNGTDSLVIIWDGQLKQWFSDFDTTRIVFVFDSCLAGGMNDVADTGRVVNMATGETQVAYVYTKEGEDVNGDGIPDGEGVFSHYFVKDGMLGGQANIHDYDRDGEFKEPIQVTVEEAFDYANEIIPSIYERQDPVISDRFSNDLLL